MKWIELLLMKKINYFYIATCDGGEDINTMLEKPIDPVTYGPFCGNC